MLVPIYDESVDIGDGSNAQFTLKGFAAFYVTGLKFGNGGKFSANVPSGCAPSERCISGYFVKFVATGDTFGGPNLGAVIVKMIG